MAPPDGDPQTSKSKRERRKAAQPRTKSVASVPTEPTASSKSSGTGSSERHPLPKKPVPKLVVGVGERSTAVKAVPVERESNKLTKRSTTDASPKKLPAAPAAALQEAKVIPFDPKSILPATKPSKDLTRLREAASSSKNKSEPFFCIDGGVRTVDPTQPVVDQSAFSSRLDEFFGEPEVKPRDVDDDEQFMAFGIRACPTRALYNEVCHDYVSRRRWCPNGSKCFRIHPVDKHLYIAESLRGSAKVEQMRAATVTGNPQAENVDEKDAKPTATAKGKGKVTKTPRRKNSKSVPASTSQEGIEHWDTITGLEPSHQTSSGSSSEEEYRYADDDSGTTSECEQRDGWVLMFNTEEDWLRGEAVVEKETRELAAFLASRQKEEEPLTGPWARKREVPQSKELCKRWIVGRCFLGRECRYTHDDKQHRGEPDLLLTTNASELWKNTIHEHIQVEISSGFEIEDIITGTESPFLVINNLLGNTTDGVLKRLLKPFGEIIEIRKIEPEPLTGLMLHNAKLEHFDYKNPDAAPKLPVTYFIQFAKSTQAYKAFGALQGTKILGRIIDVRVGVRGKQNASVVKDNSVRIDFEYPYRDVYLGFRTVEEAEAAVKRAREVPYDDKWWTVACLHRDLPAVGTFTVRFQFMPPVVDQQKMQVFGECTDMVTGPMSYPNNLEDVSREMTRICNQYCGAVMTGYEFRPPPYSQGKMRMWVFFDTPDDASSAAARLNGRMPDFMGKGRKIWAKHFRTVMYSQRNEHFQRCAPEARALSERIAAQHPGHALNFSTKATHTSIRLMGNNMSLLVSLKDEVERILHGEVVTGTDGKAVWDDFFARQEGTAYLADLQNRYPGVTVHADWRRRTLRLFGMWQRTNVRAVLERKALLLRAHRWVPIALDEHLMSALDNAALEALQQKLGADNVNLDYWTHTLQVRGGEDVLTAAGDAVAAMRQKIAYAPERRKALTHECPVCLGEAVTPVNLPCGHVYCRACAQRYLLAARESNVFPIKCLGKGGSCTGKMPLIVAKKLLTTDAFSGLLEASVNAYVQTHPKELRFCPTANCPQVYRTIEPRPEVATDVEQPGSSVQRGPRGGISGYMPTRGKVVPKRRRVPSVAIQCVGCLARTCPVCHSAAHDGRTCAESGGGGAAFLNWADKHNVKRCPKCRMGIEKVAGCNHMQCTMCKVHMCWFCMETFPDSNDIYTHMRSKHGNYGITAEEQAAALMPEPERRYEGLTLDANGVLNETFDELWMWGTISRPGTPIETPRTEPAPWGTRVGGVYDNRYRM